MADYNHRQSEDDKVVGLDNNIEGKALTVNNNVEAFLDNDSSQFTVFAPGKVNPNSGQAVLQTKPMKITTLPKVWEFITGDWAKKATEDLRKIDDKIAKGMFKKLNFYFATFSGVFRYRRASELVEHSELMVFDFDEPEIREAYAGWDIEDALKDLKARLIADEVFETELLFRSPGGKGLKWIVYVGDMEGMKHKDYFRCVADYIFEMYHVRVDESGKDVCRACFLCYDPECYINPNI